RSSHAKRTIAVNACESTWLTGFESRTGPRERVSGLPHRLVTATRQQGANRTPMSNWVMIDGSEGEGGGQLLRTALSLSLVTGRPFRIERIRARRRKPGLLRQHLTAVQAAAHVGRARVAG